MRRMKKRYLLIPAAVLYAAAVFLGYQKVNADYPAVELVSAEPGEQLECQDGVMISLQSARILTDDEAEEYHEMMGDEMPWERITIEVEVKLENQTNEEKEVDMALMYLETKGTSNGFALGADRASEGRYGATREELQPGETKKLVYPYDMSSIWFTKKEWKEIKSREFYLTISSYPEKKMLKLF